MGGGACMSLTRTELQDTFQKIVSRNQIEQYNFFFTYSLLLEI